MTDIDALIATVEGKFGRTGECKRCGLCCLIDEPVKRVPKSEPPAQILVITEGWGPGLKLRWERQGFRVAVETRGYWFMARWDPCPYQILETPDDHGVDLGEIVICNVAGLVNVLSAAMDGMRWDMPRTLKILKAVDKAGARFTCTQYDDIPDECRIWPPNNLCLWLIVRERCGYGFPLPVGDRAIMEDME